MEGRASREGNTKPEYDVWRNTWGDRALQEFGRQLSADGVPMEAAALAVEQTWLFYSYVALPTLPTPVPLGIATQHRGRAEACLYLPHRCSDNSLRDDPTAAVEGKQLHEAFDRRVAAPLAADVAMNLRFVSAVPAKVERLEPRLRNYCRYWGTTYIGVFMDRLEDELQTVMDPQSVPRWLETPNTIFAGRKPGELLRDPQDRRLRDLITRAKFDLPAA